MRFKGTLLTGVIGMLFMLGFVAGCGGSDQSGKQQGGNSSNDQSQQSTSGGSGGGTGQGDAGAQGNKIAVGKIVNVNAEARKFVVKPAKGENMKFKAVPKARIKLDGKEVELSDMKQGQQVQLNYTVRGKMGVPNRARSITLFKNGTGGGATS